MPNFFDSHCHLSSIDKLKNSYTLSNSKHYFLNVTSKPQEWQSSIDLAQNHANVFIALGLHPWFVSASWYTDMQLLNNLLNNYKVSCLGEIGLDYSLKYVFNKELQLKAFHAQVILAKQYNLPVSLHCIKAFDDLYFILKKEPLAGVLHGFNSSSTLAKQFIKLGLKIGVGSSLLHKNSKKLANTIKQVSLDDIVVETDFPNFKQNNQNLKLEQIDLLINKIASLKKEPYLVVEKILYENSLYLFSK